MQFALGDEVLLDTEHTPLPSRSLLSPRWMGLFKVLASTAPNTYRLDIPAAWRVFPEFNVERLLPYPRRLDNRAAAPIHRSTVASLRVTGTRVRHDVAGGAPARSTPQ